MKRKIDKLVKGEYIYESSGIHTEDMLLSIRMGRNEIYEGNLSINITEGKKLRGQVYSSSDRFLLKEYRLKEDAIEMSYAVNSIGLEDGEELNGRLTLVTDGGEYEVPFFVKIVKSGSNSSMGNVKNLFHFTNLAYTDYEEAYKIFCSADFERIFSENEEAERGLYDCFKKTGLTRNTMEEFLIGIHKKKRTTLHIEKSELVFEHVTDSRKGHIPLIKENWGYISADVWTDAPFIILEKKDITANDFVGKYYEFPFLIEKKRLHAGNNFGTIHIRTHKQHFVFHISVYQKNKIDHTPKKTTKKQQKACVAELVKCWLNHRTSGMSEKICMEKSLEQVEKLRDYDRTNPYYVLMQAFYYYKQSDLSKVLHTLSVFTKEDRFMKDPVFYCIYQFLKSCDGDEEEQKQVQEQIWNIYSNNRGKWQLLFLLMQSAYFTALGPARLMEEIAEQIDFGCASPILYAEAFRIFDQNPQLLKRIDKAELKIFYWAAKRGLLDQEWADRLAILSVRSSISNYVMLKFLFLLHEDFQGQQQLNAIISCLMRGGYLDKRYFKWYREGIEKELKIAGLYEAYISTANENLRKRLPTPVILYFQYNNALHYKTKAFLYANLYQYRKSYGMLYRQFASDIEKFATEQLMLGHINKNLAKLYNGILRPEMLTKELAKAMTGLLFTHELTCMNDSIRSVTVLHKYVDTWQTVPVVDHKAYISIYMEDYQLLFTDERGEIFASEEEYELRTLIDTEKFLTSCEAFFPEDGMITMYQCCKSSEGIVVGEGNVDAYIKMMDLPFVEMKYREKIREQILAYYYEQAKEDVLRPELFQIDPEYLNRTERARYIEILIAAKKYDAAYEVLNKYGYEKVSPKKLVKLLVYLIEKAEGRKNKLILRLCYNVFSLGKYDESMLRYLCDYYQGPTKEMIAVNEAADNFYMESYYLKERIIKQSIFTEKTGKEIADIFLDYQKAGGKSSVIKAFLSLHAHLFFVEKETDSTVYCEKYLNDFMKGKKMNLICKLALLKWFSENKAECIHNQETFKKLLEELCYGDYRFAFFKNFSDELLAPFFLEDKTFIEYRGDRGKQIYIHYRINRKDQEKKQMLTEKMKEVYIGIYVKEFPLFYGDVLEYYVTEHTGEETIVITETQTICEDNVFLSEKKDRYHMINDMLICEDLHDKLTLKEIHYEYERYNQMVEHLFAMEEEA